MSPSLERPTAEGWEEESAIHKIDGNSREPQPWNEFPFTHKLFPLVFTQCWGGEGRGAGEGGPPEAFWAPQTPFSAPLSQCFLCGFSAFHPYGFLSCLLWIIWEKKQQTNNLFVFHCNLSFGFLNSILYFFSGFFRGYNTCP